MGRGGMTGMRPGVLDWPGREGSVGMWMLGMRLAEVLLAARGRLALGVPLTSSRGGAATERLMRPTWLLPRELLSTGPQSVPMGTPRRAQRDGERKVWSCGMSPAAP